MVAAQPETERGKQRRRFNGRRKNSACVVSRKQNVSELKLDLFFSMATVHCLLSLPVINK